MNCFPCFQKKEDDIDKEQLEQLPVAQPRELLLPSPPRPAPSLNKECSTTTPPEVIPPPAVLDNNKQQAVDKGSVESGNSNAKTFTFRELASATKNFRQECLIGEGGFGKVFKGTLPNGEVVTVKRLDRTGAHNSKEFSVEVLVLTLLNHPNLLNLIGYCADGEQRLLIYEYMPIGCLQTHLFDIPEHKEPLNWSTRMKIASGIAQGLEYLHEKANPPIIYRDLKSSAILLDEDYNPKLSDYGLAKLEGGGGSNTLLKPRVMGTGYCAPEYERTGELTLKSDVYSFGVVLVELISGRRAVDTARPIDQQNLVEWARPIFRDPKRFPEMADPLMKNAFPMTSLNQAVGVAAMCLQEEASVRPLFGDVVAALSFLAAAPIEEPSVPVAPLPDPTQPSPENPNENTSDSDSSDDEDQNSENSSSSSDQSEDEGEESESRRGNSKRINSRSSSIRSNSSSSDDGNASSDDGNASDGLSPRRSRTAYKDDQESDSINWRNDRISDADEDVGDMSFCYSVNASMNLRSSSIAESDDGRSMRSSLRKEGSMKSENQNFGSYSSTSSYEELDEDKAWH